MAKIPDIEAPQDTGLLGWLRGWLDNLRTWVRVRDPAATTVGDPLDKFVARRELVSIGILRRSSDGTFRAGDGFGSGATIIIPGTGGGGGGSTPDLTPPPTPTGLTVTAGITTLIIEWDAPTYTTGHGNAYTKIYGAIWQDGDAEPTFSDPRTKLIDTAALQSAARAYSTDPDTTWCIWITFFSVDGVESATPAGGANGAQATTGQDVTALLTILTGQIRESQLYQALAEPIRSIVDRADDAGEDSLAAALAAHQASQRAKQGLLAEAQSRGTAIRETRTLVAEGDAQLASLITELTAVVDGNTAAIADEATARADGDAAEALQRTTLATQMRGAYTGTDVASLTEGLIYSERVARSAADSAQVIRLDLLEATVDDPTDGVAATAAALSITQNALATLDGRAAAAYTVRVQTSAGGRTVVGGFGLMGDSTSPAGSEIEFGILASRFFIEAPSGTGVTTRISPFTVQTVPFDDGGETRPAGVYIDAAFIRNLTAVYATIQALVADDITAASISVGQLTAGSIAVGEHIQSSGFTSGTGATPGIGFRWSGNGDFEANNALLRGTIYATAGRIGGIVIGPDYIQGEDFVLGSAGWQLTPTSAQLPSTNIIGTLTTTQLAPGAATLTDMEEDAGPYSGTANAAAVTITPPVTCNALVTVDMNFQCTNSTGAAALIYGAFNVGMDDGSYGAYADRFVSQTLVPGDTLRFPVSIRYLFRDLPAGVAHTFSAVYSDHMTSALTGSVANLRTQVELILR